MLKKNNTLLNFLEEQSTGYYQLIDQIVAYLNTTFGLSRVLVYKHKNAPDCFETLGFHEQDNSYREIIFSAVKAEQIAPSNLLCINEIYILPLINHYQEVNYILVIEATRNQIDNIPPEFWAEINTVYKLAKMNEEMSREFAMDRSIQIVSRMAHDINSIITLIPASHDQALNERISYSKQLSENIMSYLRNPSLQKGWYSVRELFEGILAGIERVDGIKYRQHFDDNLNYVNVDVELIEQSLHEVLENATFACQIAGSEIEITFKRNKNMSIFKNHDWLTISVKDNGPGIPAEYISEVIKPLFTTWKDQGHVGIGLAMADKIIQAHGGSLSVLGEPGKGTQISFYLPLYDAKI